MLSRVLIQVALACLAIAVNLVTEQALGLFTSIQEPYVLPQHEPDAHLLGRYLALSGDGSTLVSRAAVGDANKHTVSVFYKDPETRKWSLQANLSVPPSFNTNIKISYDGNVVVGADDYYNKKVYVFTRIGTYWSPSQIISPPTIKATPQGFGRNLAFSSDASTLIVCLDYYIGETNVGPLAVYKKQQCSYVFDGYVFTHTNLFSRCVTGAYPSMVISPDGNTLIAIIEKADAPASHGYNIRAFRRTSPNRWVEYDFPINGTLDEFYGDEFQVRALAKNGQFAFVTLLGMGHLNILHRNDEQAAFEIVADKNVTFEGSTDFVLHGHQQLIVDEDMTKMIVQKTTVKDLMNGEVEGISIAYDLTVSPNEEVDFSNVYQVLRTHSDDIDILGNFGSAAALSHDASTLVVASADDYPPAAIFFYENDASITYAPSMSPTQQKCRIPSRATRAQCKAVMKRCPEVKLKWLEQGCGNGDKGCKCRTYCNHNCKKGCAADPYCKWKNGKCATIR